MLSDERAIVNVCFSGRSSVSTDRRIGATRRGFLTPYTPSARSRATSAPVREPFRRW